MAFIQSNRLQKLPPYLFAKIDDLKQTALDAGKDVISLSVGDPDLPTVRPVIDRAKEVIEDPATHQYPSYIGMPSFREAVAQWYQQRFAVTLKPDTEVVTLIGAKEGISHLPLGFVNPGDVVLIPSPAYPAYFSGTIMAGGTPYLMPLKKENDWFPDYDAIPKRILKKAKLMWINYPNNPTAQVATPEFFKRTVALASQYGIIVAHDAPYSELYYDGHKPHSFLETPGAKEVGVEFHSLSKTCNMTGWRIGMCVGNASVIKALGDVKKNMDSGAFNVIQLAAIKGLLESDEQIAANRAEWHTRRDVLAEGLRSAGWEITPPKATFYFWIENRPGYSSMQMVAKLLEDASIVCTPGNGFGADGEGYIRMTFTVSAKRLREAVERIKRIQW